MICQIWKLKLYLFLEGIQSAWRDRWWYHLHSLHCKNAQPWLRSSIFKKKYKKKWTPEKKDKVNGLLYESKVSSQTIGICCSIVIWKFAYYFPLTSITRGVNLEIQNVMDYLESIFLLCLLSLPITHIFIGYNSNKLSTYRHFACFEGHGFVLSSMRVEWNIVQPRQNL
jgi:hypothetical protein